VASIFAAKERPTFDPLICHVPATSGRWLSHLAEQGLVHAALLSAEAQRSVERLAEAFWPGPLTLVLPRLPGVPDLVTSGLPTVGVRCPRHEVAQLLLQEVALPLAAPSANRFGRISPTAAEHVLAELGDRIAYIIDGGNCQIGIESTVLLIEPAGRLVVLRPGDVSAEQIAHVAGVDVENQASAAAVATPLPAPGMLASHYAPRKPLHLLPKLLATMTQSDRDAWLTASAEARLGVLTMSGDSGLLTRDLQPLAVQHHKTIDVVSLSATGDAHEAARQLFAQLRSLDDRADIDELWAELHPAHHGLGHAINDRLRRASYRG